MLGIYEDDGQFIPAESPDNICPERNFAERIVLKQADATGQPLSHIKYWDEGAAVMMVNDLMARGPSGSPKSICSNILRNGKARIMLAHGGSYSWTTLTDEDYGFNFRFACHAADITLFKEAFFPALAGCHDPRSRLQ